MLGLGLQGCLETLGRGNGVKKRDLKEGDLQAPWVWECLWPEEESATQLLLRGDRKPAEDLVIRVL